jgi:tRNA-dihydrouridine synthase
MIGRGALRNPWIFQECLGHRENVPGEPHALLGRYLELLRSQYDLHNTHILLRKFAAWLVFGYPGAAAFRGVIYRLLTVDELMQSAGEFFSKVAHLPRPQFEYSEVFMTSGHG